MKVIIIGGIAAGMSAAAKLKRMSPNDEVIVYEKGDIVSFGACGLPYYAGGFFDDSNEMIARTAEEFRKTGINLFTNHEVLEVDFDNKKLRVKDLIQNMIIEESYDKLMIASGASSIIPPIKGIDSENVLTLKSMDDGNKLRALMENENLKRVTVIGAGFIGVEAVEGHGDLPVTAGVSGNDELHHAWQIPCPHDGRLHRLRRSRASGQAALLL